MGFSFKRADSGLFRKLSRQGILRGIIKDILESCSGNIWVSLKEFLGSSLNFASIGSSK